MDKEQQRICIYMRAGQLGDIQAGIDSDDGEYDDDSEDHDDDGNDNDDNDERDDDICIYMGAGQLGDIQAGIDTPHPLSYKERHSYRQTVIQTQRHP